MSSSSKLVHFTAMDRYVYDHLPATISQAMTVRQVASRLRIPLKSAYWSLWHLFTEGLAGIIDYPGARGIRYFRLDPK